MKRRNILAGMATIAGIGGSVIGSGAFSNSTAQRDIRVELEDDSGGILSLQGTPTDNRTYTEETSNENDIVKFSFPGHNDEPAVNVDAVVQYETEYGAEDNLALLRIANNGTRKVQLSDKPDKELGSDKPSVGVFHINSTPKDNGLKPLLREDSVALEPGDIKGFGIEINTHGVDAGASYETSVYISADDKSS